MYIPLGIAPVNLTAILILTPPLRSHPSIPVRTAKIESHTGTKYLREMTGKNIKGKSENRKQKTERKSRER